MARKYCINEVCLTGRITSPIVKNHRRDGKDFYKFYVSAARLSGINDVIPVIISEELLKESKFEYKFDEIVRVNGDYRSYKDRKGKLNLYVYVKDIANVDESALQDLENRNIIEIEGYVCKASPIRITPMGRKIMDVILAVNRGYKSSYIPCIFWELSDEMTEKIKVGKLMTLYGRIQSRDYEKKYDDLTLEIKTAYEVSVSAFKIVESDE